MKYLVYLALMFGSFIAYLQVTKAYAKKVQKDYDPLEHEYDLEEDEDKKKEILEKLSKMEEKAYQVNTAILVSFITLILIETAIVIIYPIIANVSNEMTWITENVYVGIITYIFIALGLIFNIKMFFVMYEACFSGVIYELKEWLTSRDKREDQEALHCIYPDRFPLTQYDILSAYRLFSGHIY